MIETQGPVQMYMYSILYKWILCLFHNRVSVLLSDVESENFDVSLLPKETLNTIEADSFWCTSKLLDGIQDNYTFAQPGIQMKVNALKELIKRIDGKQ